jgi:hypothetical protein
MSQVAQMDSREYNSLLRREQMVAAPAQSPLFGFFEAINPVVELIVEGHGVTITDGELIGEGVAHDYWHVIPLGERDDKSRLYLRDNGSWVFTTPGYHNRFPLQHTATDDEVLKGTGLELLVRRMIMRLAAHLKDGDDEHWDEYAGALANLNNLLTQDGS